MSYLILARSFSDMETVCNEVRQLLHYRHHCMTDVLGIWFDPDLVDRVPEVLPTAVPTAPTIHVVETIGISGRWVLCRLSGDVHRQNDLLHSLALTVCPKVHSHSASDS